MHPFVLRTVVSFPEPGFAALAAEAFSDHQPSALLADVLRAEAATQASAPVPTPTPAAAGTASTLRIQAQVAPIRRADTP